MNLSTVDLFKNIHRNNDQGIHIEGDILRKYQKALTEIAKDIISVCEKENVIYHLTGGSCLGAIRHKGFIPWDDDMDIDILGSDFDRFTDAFSKKYPDKYWIHTCSSPEYGMVINRVRLKGSVFRGREDAGNDECGFFVDLMRIENVFDNPVLRILHGYACLGMGFLLSCRNFYKNKNLMLKLAGDSKKVKNVFLLKINIGRLLGFVSVSKLAVLTQKCYGLCKNNCSRFVSVPSGRKHYFGEMYERKAFVETERAEFEGNKWCVPKEYDAYLKHMYGDYMKIPKENEREEHILLELKFPDEVNEQCSESKEL